jgi:epsilon-lactone hydrolase
MNQRPSTPNDVSHEVQLFYKNAKPIRQRKVDFSTIENLRNTNYRESKEDSACAESEYLSEMIDIKLAGVETRRLTPKTRREEMDDKAILYLFGGAYVIGGPVEDLPISAYLSHRLGVKVFSPYYPRAPENPFPAALEAARDVYRGMLEEYAAEKIVIAGNSAGAGLALAMFSSAEDILPTPAGLALLSPWCDLTAAGNTQSMPTGFDPTMDYDLKLASASLAYAGDLDLRDPGISPIYAEFDNFRAPVLVTSGTRDIFLSDCARLTTKLRRAGVDCDLHVWEGLWHVFQLYDLPEARDSLDEVAKFLGNLLNADCV